MPEIWIALLRGVNVGGGNKLPMASLRAILDRVGATDVQTYIQSGNAVFGHAETDAAKVGNMIGSGVQKRHGFRPKVLAMTAAEMARAAEANPFPSAEAEPKTLHLYFLAEPSATPDIDTICALASGSETFTLTDSVFYLHAPDGIGRSKLAQRVERLLGVEATARNWRTVANVLAMARSTEAASDLSA
ncbi:MAG: DUF1697 domain-containing protein [Pseudomonadota bacterium]